MNIFEMLITNPMGYIIRFIYDFVNSYGWAVILFTVAIKLIIAPLSVKQQKSMTKMQRVQPLLQRLQEKYKDDKERLNQETMKLYKEFGVSPGGGCLPLLIQFPIIIGLYQVINRPLEFILHLPKETAELIAKEFGGEKISQIVACTNADAISKYGFEKLNFSFFGLDLSHNPTFSFIDWYWLIPVLAAVTAYLSTFIMQKLQGTNQNQQQGSMKFMNYLMPLMSAYFCFILPSGVGLYWIASNVIQVIQTVVLDKIFKNKNQEEEIDVDEYFKKNRGNGKKHK